MARNETYHIQDRVPTSIAIGTGFQHVLTMFGATVLGPLLMGFDPNVAILLSGVATIFFWFVVGGNIPSYLGSSFSFIAVVTTITHYTGDAGTPNGAIALGLGGIISAGVVYLLIAFVILMIGYNWVNRLLPSVVTGSIIATIGINLAPVAANEIGGNSFNTLVGFSTIFLVAIPAVYPAQDNFIRAIPILIGGLLSTALYVVGANIFHLSQPIDPTPLWTTKPFGVPHLFPATPRFSLDAILLASPVALILVAENLGHIRAIAAMNDPDKPEALDPFIGRAFLGDAISTIVSGLFGGPGLTTYAENIGAMSITQVFASRVFLVAGALACALGFSPWFGALIRLIPAPVIGGLSFVIFGLIVAAGLRVFGTGHVDFNKQINSLVAGITLVIASAGLSFSMGRVNLGAIATASVTSIFLYHILKRGKSASDVQEVRQPNTDPIGH